MWYLTSGFNSMKIFRKSDTPLSQEEIYEWLKDLRGNPYVPESGFDVTSVFRVAEKGSHFYFAGVNVESAHHRLSTHAEECSIAAMVTALGKKAEIAEGWVMGAPKNLKAGDDVPLAYNCVTCCGKCRQQIAGFADPSTTINSISLNGSSKKTTVGELLPDAFSFRDFAPELAGEKKDMLPISTKDEIENRLIRTHKHLSEQEIKEWLQSLESIDYASKVSQAVVLKISNGAYVAGVKIEDAAFVSMDALQTAEAIANAEFGPHKIAEVWCYGKGRDDKQIPEDEFVSISGSGIQVIKEFASYSKIPVNLLNNEGVFRTLNIDSLSKYIPTTSHPSTKIGPERYIK